MSFASAGALGSASSNTSGSTLAITTTATAEVGHLIVVASAWDNTGTADTALDTHLKVTDSAGNIYTILGSITNGRGAAAGGAQVLLAYTVVTTELSSGGTITVTSDTNRTAKAAAAHEFTMGSANVAMADGEVSLVVAGDPGAITLPTSFTTLASREYLMLYALASEGPTSDSFTWDSDYTQLATDGAGTGTSAMSIRWGYRIATLTGDTVDVTNNTAGRDNVGILVAMFEYDPVNFPLTPILDDFNRANETPLSGGGTWERTQAANPLNLSGNGVSIGTVNVVSGSNRTEDHPGAMEVYFDHTVSNSAVAGSGPVLYINLADTTSANWDGYRIRRRESVTGTVHDQLHIQRFVNNANTRNLMQWIGLTGGALTTTDKYGARRTEDDVLEIWWQPNGGSWTFLGAWEIVGDLVGGRIGLGSTEGTAVANTTKMDNFGGGSYFSLPFIPSTTTVYTPTLALQFDLGFIASTTTVYAPSLALQLDLGFIASATTVYAPSIALQLDVPFISSSTVVYTPTLADVASDTITVPFIPSATVVYPLMSLFRDTVGLATGNGGELFSLLLAPNGTSETATLAASISDTATALMLTGYSSLPPTGGYVLTIDDEQLYVVALGGGQYRVAGRGLGNTTPAAHTAGATASWGDSYDHAIVAEANIAQEFTADINEQGEQTYSGWLMAFDSTQAYIGATRYPMHVGEVVGVFDAGAGVTGTNRIDAAQPASIYTPAATSDDCPAALSNPARIQTDILGGDVAVLRYTNPEAATMKLGSRSAGLQSFFGMKRVDDDDNDVTFTDPDGHIVDGSVNGEWDNPLGPGIEPFTGEPTTTDVPYTSVTLDGDERTFTHGGTPSPPNFEEKGWPICALAVRHGVRRVPYWQSFDWHDFSYVYSGFSPDATYCQILINRNGIFYDSIPDVDFPGPQDTDGPDAVWDDGSYRFGASWYVAIWAGHYLVIGPPIGATAPPSATVLPTVVFGAVPSVDFDVEIPVIVEGGSGGGISPPYGMHAVRASAGGGGGGAGGTPFVPGTMYGVSKRLRRDHTGEGS